MKKLLFLLPLLAIFSCSDPDNLNRAKFNNSGCLECDNYAAGESFIVGGVRYQVADSTALVYAIDDGLDLSRYCTSRIVNMRGLFKFKDSLNQDISSWDVSNVTNMQGMFLQASNFNQDIGNWDVSNVTTMSNMFSEASNFNQDIGSWDVSNVTDMEQMFWGASSFNQDLTQWCVSNISSMPGGFAWNNFLTSNHPVWATCP